MVDTTLDHCLHWLKGRVTQGHNIMRHEICCWCGQKAIWRVATEWPIEGYHGLYGVAPLSELMEPPTLARAPTTQCRRPNY